MSRRAQTDNKTANTQRIAKKETADKAPLQPAGTAVPMQNIKKTRRKKEWAKR
jgi:hypothetical protein